MPTIDLIDRWTYESVEYSEGYHHSVFDPSGNLFQEFHTENKAREFADAKNKEAGL